MMLKKIATTVTVIAMVMATTNSSVLDTNAAKSKDPYVSFSDGLVSSIRENLAKNTIDVISIENAALDGMDIRDISPSDILNQMSDKVCYTAINNSKMKYAFVRDDTNASFEWTLSKSYGYYYAGNIELATLAGTYSINLIDDGIKIVDLENDRVNIVAYDEVIPNDVKNNQIILVDGEFVASSFEIALVDTVYDYMCCNDAIDQIKKELDRYYGEDKLNSLTQELVQFYDGGSSNATAVSAVIDDLLDSGVSMTDIDLKAVFKEMGVAAYTGGCPDSGETSFKVKSDDAVGTNIIEIDYDNNGFGITEISSIKCSGVYDGRILTMTANAFIDEDGKKKFRFIFSSGDRTSEEVIVDMAEGDYQGYHIKIFDSSTPTMDTASVAVLYGLIQWNASMNR